MRTISHISILLILLSNTIDAQNFPVSKIMNSGDNDSRINFVYLPDGFTGAELNSFSVNATDINDALFSQPPFANYINFFNAFTIAVPSNESGIDHPGTATDVSEPVIPVDFEDTYFDATFDGFGIHRLLVANNSPALNNVLMTNLPFYDQALVICNSTEYGGSGGPIAVTSIDPSAFEIAIHEFGHSFAGLSDEYWAGEVYARENYNMTKETNPAQVRWDEWHGEFGIGIYQYCCGGTSNSWYRPHQNCKMRVLGAPFCAVCRQRIIDRIYELVQPIRSYSPPLTSLGFNGPTMNFSLDLILPIPNTLRVEWELNGSILSGENADSYMLNASSLMSGTNTLIGRVYDQTTQSRSYLPAAGYDFFVEWTINYSDLPFCDSSIIAELNMPVIQTNIHAGNTIQTNGTVPSNQMIVYKAEQTIELLEQFEVKQDAVFSALIAPCF